MILPSQRKKIFARQADPMEKYRDLATTPSAPGSASLIVRALVNSTCSHPPDRMRAKEDVLDCVKRRREQQIE